MAIRCRVYEALPGDSSDADGGFTERRQCRFFGPELPMGDLSFFDVTFLDADNLATAEGRIVDGAIAEWQRVRGALGVPALNLARGRVVYPRLARGA